MAERVARAAARLAEAARAAAPDVGGSEGLQVLYEGGAAPEMVELQAALEAYEARRQALRRELERLKGQAGD